MHVKFAFLSLLSTIISVQLRDPLGSVMQRLGCLVAPSFLVPGHIRQPRSTLARVATGALRFSIVASESGALQSEASWQVSETRNFEEAAYLRLGASRWNFAQVHSGFALLRACRRWPRVQINALNCLDPGTALPHCLQAAHMAMC